MRLTLLQMMKLVVGCACASAYILPLVRLAEAGIAPRSTMIVVGAISVPLVFALVTIALARRGPLKDWLIRVLIMTSIGVTLVVGTYAFVTAGTIWFRRGGPSDLHSLATLAVLGFPVIALCLIFTRLMWSVVAARGLAPRGLALGTTATGDPTVLVLSDDSKRIG